jgi:hypothetical protein
VDHKINYPKAAFVLVMAVYGIICARNPALPRFLDRVDLVAHESGHLFFRWFGEFLQVLGGTLGQLFVPTAFTVYFVLQRQFFSSAVTFFWIGQNLFNISVYVKDAQTMDLPLISVGGSDNTIHDWNYILSRLGLLRWDHAVGNTIYVLGIVVIAASVVAGLYCSFDAEENPPSA